MLSILYFIAKVNRDYMVLYLVYEDLSYQQFAE